MRRFVLLGVILAVFAAIIVGEPAAGMVFKRATQTAGQAMAEKREDFRTVMAALGEITGDQASDELLHTIFARFCIGK